MIEFVYNFSLIQLSFELIGVLDTLFNYIVKSANHYPYYKKNLEMTESIYKPFLFWSTSQLSISIISFN